MQIRRELIDLARHYYGPCGRAAKHQSQGLKLDADSQSPGALDPAASSSLEPSRLAA
jgi:hypothetical protein